MLVEHERGLSSQVLSWNKHLHNHGRLASPCCTTSVNKSGFGCSCPSPRQKSPWPYLSCSRRRQSRLAHHSLWGTQLVVCKLCQAQVPFQFQASRLESRRPESQLGLNPTRLKKVYLLGLKDPCDCRREAREVCPRCRSTRRAPTSILQLVIYRGDLYQHLVFCGCCGTFSTGARRQRHRDLGLCRTFAWQRPRA
jgi:hypothetical protein